MKKSIMTRYYILLIFILSLVSSCLNNKSSDDSSSDVISQDSLINLKKYIHDTILSNTQYKFEKGDTVNVIKTLVRLYQTDTNNVQYIIDLANGLIAAYNTKEALAFLDIALQKDKTYSDKIFFAKSLAWSFRLNNDSSFFYLNKAVDIDKLGVKYLFHRSRKYEEAGFFDKAIIDINEAIKRQPKNIGLYVYRGIYKKGIEDYKGALIDMKEIPTYLQNDANVYGNRAAIHLKLGNFKECITDCNRSISLNPNNGDVYLIRGNAKSNLQDFEGAFNDLKKSVDLGNQEAVPLYKEYKEYFDTHKKI